MPESYQRLRCPTCEVTLSGPGVGGCPVCGWRPHL